jgi:hypothetical protein
MEAEALLPDLHEELAFQRVEPFILVIMQVARGTAPGMERVLEDEEAVAILGANLERNGADAQSTVLA